MGKAACTATAVKMGAKTEGRRCPVGIPSGVKKDGTPRNVLIALRGSAPVFRPQTSRSPALLH